jgi:REP element-mobilizing transposase RayT
LKGYDYALAGAYFVTISTQDHVCVFGDVVEGVMCLSDAGLMVSTEWGALPARFPGVDLDAFVVMPNHIHGLIVFATRVSVGAPLVGAQDVMPNGTCDNRATTRVAPTLGKVVGAFKSRLTVEYTRGIKTQGWSAFRRRLWQRKFYEHIIRNEASLNRIRQYILDNPAQWTFDRENPRWSRQRCSPRPGRRHEEELQQFCTWSVYDSSQR